MRNFLAYSNSDQASFRDASVQEAFDYLTVPGTIAAFYAEATAAFVLSSQLNYVIDPRTPLFQDIIAPPRASHISLAQQCGPSLAAAVATAATGQYVSLAPGFFSPAVIQELVDAMLAFQMTYGGRAGTIGQKLARYRAMLSEASPALVSDTGSEDRPPSFVLAPYFCVSGASDPWWRVVEELWRTCANRADASQICAVVAVDSPETLRDIVARVPGALASTIFFWVQGFSERRMLEESLLAMWESVRSLSVDKALVNMYGGFFSICTHHAGLWGNGSGLAYSESREWPELAATGAAPARYYLPALHTFVSPVVAQVITEADPEFRCPCTVCQSYGWAVAGMPYADLKNHFALARSGEIRLVTSEPLGSIAASLSGAHERFSAVRIELARRIPAIDTSYLMRWARVLQGAG
jgi:hypothetical protein